MATISVIYRKDKLNKHGLAPVHLRVIKDRKINYISTSISLKESEWDEKNKKVKKAHPNSARFNSFIANKFTELQDQVFEHETVLKSLTARQLKNKVFGHKPSNFFEIAKQVLELYEKQKMYGTYDKCKSIINKIEKYVGSNNLQLQDITIDFLKKYDAYCRSKFENKTNTVHKDLKFIRRVINEAIQEDKFEMQQSPFLKYKLKTEKTQRVYLNELELEQFASVECTPGTRLELHKDMFVFASYAGGLRVSDVLQLKWKNLDNTHIHFTIKKTGNQISIKVPDKALEIINKYKPTKITPNDFIFPMLSNGLDENNLRLIDREISGATAYINKNLKILAKKAELNKHISFHISRHTFATRALTKGISIDKVSKLMGHAQIKETQIYAKIVNEELDKAMDVFNG